VRGNAILTKSTYIMVSMRPDVIPRHWLSREIRSAFVLLVWVAFAFAILLNLFDWPPFRKFIAVRSLAHPAETKRVIDVDKLYTGSIFFVSPSGDSCLERMIDNRTGNMWDNGYVDCYELARALGQPRPNTEGAERVRAIGAALRHDEH